MSWSRATAESEVVNSGFCFTLQDVVAGDGTTSVVVICGALLKKCQELLEKGIHPTVVSDSFNLAANKACEVRRGAEGNWVSSSWGCDGLDVLQSTICPSSAAPGNMTISSRAWKTIFTVPCLQSLGLNSS